MASTSESSILSFLRNYIHFPVLPKTFTIPGVGAINVPSFSAFGEKWSTLSKKTRWSIVLGGITLSMVALYLRRSSAHAARRSVRPRRSRAGSESRARTLSRRYKNSINSVCQSVADSTSASVVGSVIRSNGPSAIPSSYFMGIGTGDPHASSSVVELDVNPQQLCQMGHECLEQAITYWEDALDLLEYLPGNGGISGPPALPTAKEAQLVRELQILVEKASSLANQLKDNIIKPAEELPNGKTKNTSVSSASYDRMHHVLDATSSSDGAPSAPSFATAVRSVSISETSEAESFVSAVSDGGGRLSVYSSQETLLPDGDAFGDEDPVLFREGILEIDSIGVEARKIRTAMLNCANDREFLGKLSAIRRAFDALLADNSIRSWFVSMGRQMIGDLMAKAEKDPSGFYSAYDEMIQYVDRPDAFTKTWDELQSRNVKAMNFYDVVLDFMFLDAFDDLSNPPGSVVSIIQNRWLSSGFKESALQTAVFCVLKSKRHSLKYLDGFMSHFYDVSEHVTPFLAWGFLGPDEQLKTLTGYFHDHLLGFIQDVFSFHRIRYVSLDAMKADIMKVAQKRIERVLAMLDLDGATNGSISPTDAPFDGLDAAHLPDDLNAQQ